MTDMTTTELNAEIQQSLGIIADNEGLLTRAAKYLRRLAKELTNDPTKMSEAEFFARVDEAIEQARQGNVYRQMPGESFTEFRNRIGR